MSDLGVRRADAGDVAEILEVLRLALGEPPLLRRTEDLWNWKHESNPFGRSLVLVAESEGRIAGVRALMRWELKTPTGHKLRCLRPVDTATHPDFARRGVFKELTTSAIDIARSEGVDLVFNTPNEKSRPGYLKMGWRDVAPIGVLVRPRLGRALTPDISGPPSIEEVAPQLDPFEDTTPVVIDREPRGLRTPREPDYLSWRFAQHPTARYGWLGDGNGSGLVARVGVRRMRTELVVSDLIDVTHPRVVRRAAAQARARYLAGWFSRHTPERRAAILGGMLPVPGIRTLSLVALPLNVLDFDVFNLDSWDMSTSDLELL